jgi:ribosomal protein S18 acetylase RimI-like enzyme
MRTIPGSWSTTQLSISDTIASELKLLQQFYANSFNEEWVGSAKPDREYMRNMFDRKAVPNDANAESFSLQTIRAQGRIVGFFHVLEAYPKPATTFIGMLLFDQAYKGLGLGRELVQALSTQLDACSEIKLSVELKNWEGLRFWIAAGFDSIEKYAGDPTYASDNSARMVLCKGLN